MGKKSTSLLLAGIAAGAYAYFKKPENRDKAVEAFNSTKVKVNDFLETQRQVIQTKVDELNDSKKVEDDVESTIDEKEMDYMIDEKEMVSEGAMTKVQYHNDEVQERLDTKERNYFIDDKNMVSEGALTKVHYEDAEEQLHADEDKLAEKTNADSDKNHN